MQISRIYTGPDGESHFDELYIPLEDAGDIGALSEAFAVEEVIFRHTAGDYHYQWHNAPARQFILMLEGSVEVETSDGERRIFNTGDILLAEDTTGRGHISRAVNGRPRKSVFIVLAPETRITGESSSLY